MDQDRPLLVADELPKQARIHRKPIPSTTTAEKASSLESGSWWTFEVLAACFSLLAFTALVVLVQHFNGKPQSSWSYQHLSLNGAVALLATVTKASLLIGVAASISQAKWSWFSSQPRSIKGKTIATRFGDLSIFDDASRGAWGSMIMLWRTGAFHLASVGAGLMILSLAFDTFAQQVLSTDFRQVLITNNLTAAVPIPHSQYYSDASLPTANDQAFPSSWINLNLMSYIYNAIFSDNVTALQATCATGDCEWPIIPTLAVCGGCDDATEYPTGAAILNGTNSDVVMTVAQVNPPGTPGGNTSSAGLFISPGPNNTNVTYLTNFNIVGTKNQALNTTTHPGKMYSTNCSLWLCVQALKVSVVSGRSAQEVVSTYSTPSYVNNDSIVFESLPEQFNAMERDLENSSSDSYFGVHILPLQGFSDFFTSNIWKDAYVLNNGPNIADAAEEVQFSGPIAQALWYSSGNLDGVAQQLALSMTNYLRLTAPANSTENSKFYAGTAFEI